MVNLGKGMGREFSGRRYVTVVSDDLTIFVEATIAVVPAIDHSREPTQKYGVPVGGVESGLPVDLLFIPTQIRALDFSRFKKPALGRVPDAQLKIIARELKRTLAIGETA